MAELDDLKYNIVKRVTTTENFGVVYVRDEAKIRFIVENADVGNTLRIQGRLIGQNTWVQLLDITGTDNQVLDITTYEEMQVFVFAYDSLSDHVQINASSFDNVSSSILSKDEGSTLTSTTTSLNFTGAGVTATNVGGAVTVNIPTAAGATFLTATAVIDWASIGGDLHLDFPVSVPGALLNDFVVLGLPVDIDGGTVTEAFVSAADVVTIRSHNVIAVAVDQPAKTYKVLVIQP